MFGKEEFKNVLYLIDYGLCKKYRYRSGQHIKFAYTKKLNGTAKYASVYALSGYELSRRDDLEGLCYMIVYLIHGHLPWEKIKNKNKHERYKIIYHMKKNLTAEQLIKHTDKPEFIEFIKYCKELKFEENPNYDYLRGLMMKFLNRNNVIIKTDNDINLIFLATLLKGKNNNYSPDKKISKNIIEKVCEEESLSNFDYYNNCINESISKSIEDIGKKVRNYANSCTKKKILDCGNKANNIKSLFFRDLHKNVSVTKMTNNINNINNISSINNINVINNIKNIKIMKNIPGYMDQKNYEKENKITRSTKKFRYTKNTRLNYIKRALGIFKIEERNEDKKEECKEENNKETNEENKENSEEKNKEEKKIKNINLHHSSINLKNMKYKKFATGHKNKKIDDNEKENCCIF